MILYDSDWNPQVDLQVCLFCLYFFFQFHCVTRSFTQMHCCFFFYFSGDGSCTSNWRKEASPSKSHKGLVALQQMRLSKFCFIQVFRFVSEGTIEEKIIERADRKLFLDAAVIQQGRLAEQNSSLEKDELMKMVKFGADEILSGKGGRYSDEDIDALIARGEDKTSEFNAKLQTDAQHNLANFSLLGDDDEAGHDTFAFHGKNYRDSDKTKGNFINLPQRQRKRNYDLGAAEQSGSKVVKAHAAEAAAKKKRKGPALHDFQLFDLDRINVISTMERSLASQKEDQLRKIRDLQASAANAPSIGSGVAAGHSREELLTRAAQLTASLDSIKLSEEEEQEKTRLLAEGKSSLQ